MKVEERRISYELSKKLDDIGFRDVAYDDKFYAGKTYKNRQWQTEEGKLYGSRYSEEMGIEGVSMYPAPTLSFLATWFRNYKGYDLCPVPYNTEAKIPSYCIYLNAKPIKNLNGPELFATYENALEFGIMTIILKLYDENQKKRNEIIDFYCKQFIIERNEDVENFYDECVVPKLLEHYPEDSDTLKMMFAAYKYLSK